MRTASFVIDFRAAGLDFDNELPALKAAQWVDQGLRVTHVEWSTPLGFVFHMSDEDGECEALPYPGLQALNANAIAYELECRDTGHACKLTTDAAKVAWLRHLAVQLDRLAKVRDARG